jgi:thiamine transport system permease protein
VIARRASFVFFLIFLLFPYGILLFKLNSLSPIDLDETWWSLKNSMAQAALSALGSLLMGIWMTLGFFKLQRSLGAGHIFIRFLQFFLLLPTFLPPLFILLILLSLLNPFPTGMPGVVLAHVLINAGLVTLVLKTLVEKKMRILLEEASVYGVSQSRFLLMGWGLLRRDLISLFLFVFVVCFSSFSIPLIAGAGKATTLEILIYEKIRIGGNWGEALSLSFLQISLIFLLSFLSAPERRLLFGRGQEIPLLGSTSGLVMMLIYCVGLPLFFLQQSLSGWNQVFQIPGLWELCLQVLPLSLGLGLAVGFIILALLLLTAYGAPSMALHRLIQGMVSPSTALLGFSLLFFLSNEEPWNFIKWAIGFSYLVFATLYRWTWDQELSGLYDQIRVAETLGASRNLIFREVLFPQLIQPACRIAAVASLWALGDFALGKILIAQDVTLSLVIESLMSSYRLQSALALLSLVFLMGIFCYLLFWSLAYVSRRTAQ